MREGRGITVGDDCPFCRLQVGVFDYRNRAHDVVGVTQRAYARIAPKWWPANAGGALVIPRHHVENLYDISQVDGHAVWDLTQRVAAAMRSSYGCQGVSIRQHNEPAGGQDVWHLHVHVLPRYQNDELYQRHLEARWVPADERRPFADLLRASVQLPTSFS
ncbi:diadenosine tetraphosphate hydrolase [Serinicoccus chungangensis]|uniref:Diadenosine tetraphosphate hydrolase n=1 Tax=Serinicoccus chungangensis TaxID=767452 RepID=A0A0W8I3D8_9MICO|nr:diadenosine tetraphosphate hydrolase [Serinicoccus chungangensis]